MKRCGRDGGTQSSLVTAIYRVKMDSPVAAPALSHGLGGDTDAMID